MVNNFKFKEEDNKKEDNKKSSTEKIEDNQKTVDLKKEEKVEEKVEVGIGGDEIDTHPITEQEQKIIDIKKTTSFIKPVQAKITSVFGLRDSKGGTIPKNHTGIDFGVYEGTEIISATDGQVELVSDEGGYGTHVKIKIGEVSVIYAHCKEILVNKDDMVQQGQKIAISGNTGNSTGPHLHFEIRYKNEPINPNTLLEL